MNRFLYFSFIILALSKTNCSTKINERKKFKMSDFTYNLDGSTVDRGGGGGNIYKAFLSDFPALEGENLAFALFEILPCGINLPHFHPRATELIYVY